MSDAIPVPMASGRPSRQAVQANLAKRQAAERRFRLLGLGAVLLGLSFVVVLFGTILAKGLPAFWQATIDAEVYFDPEVVQIDAKPVRQSGQSSAEFEAAMLTWQGQLARVNWNRVIVASMEQLVPEAQGETRPLLGLVTSGERFVLRDMVERNPSLIGQRVPVRLLADANVDVWVKGNIDRNVAAERLPLSPDQRRWVDQLEQEGVIKSTFSWVLFTNPDSRSSPASAGLLGAFMGSLFMMLIVVLLSVPLAVASAVYLEEFAPKNRLTDFIEVNINNLAAVPSIVFGLLGVAVFINYMHLPLSAPLVGGLVLTLMTLPTVIIATRAALKAVPPSIREAALGVGASKVQTIGHHVLPLALPGVLTGAIIGVAQALGETAPLLLIGMNAFVASVPTSPWDQATALPAQIYLWQANELRNFFEARTSAAIIVLLALMLALNGLAIYLRKRFETRW